MAEQVARLQTGIEICYESFGRVEDPALLLVMGLGGPMGWCDLPFCEQLAARGFFVTRFDNRDTGRSSQVSGHDPVRRWQLVANFLRLSRFAPYSMADLADAATGLLRSLGVERAPLVGISMGGMIAQTMAIRHPSLVASLTSIMSTTGARTVGWQSPGLLPLLLQGAGNDRAGYVERAQLVGRRIGSPDFEPDTDMVRARAEETYDRGWTAAGVTRQMLAILTQPDRTPQLRQLTVPTCVIHGLADPMVHVSGGRATARAVPGAELVLIPGLAHDLPPQVWPTVLDAIERTARRSDATATSPASSTSTRPR